MKIVHPASSAKTSALVEGVVPSVAESIENIKEMAAPVLAKLEAEVEKVGAKIDDKVIEPILVGVDELRHVDGPGPGQTTPYPPTKPQAVTEQTDVVDELKAEFKKVEGKIIEPVEAVLSELKNVTHPAPMPTTDVFQPPYVVGTNELRHVQAPPPGEHAITVPVATAMAQPSASSGAVVSNTSAPVGSSAATAPAATTGFLAVVKEAAADAKAIELGIEKFSAKLQAAVVDILETGTPIAKDFINLTLRYLKEHAPNSSAPAEVSQLAQIHWFRDLVNVVNNGATDFRKLFSIFLAIMHEVKDEKSAFSLPHFFRHLPSINMSSDDRTAMQNLVWLFHKTSGVESRAAALKHVDLTAATAKGLMTTGIDRLRAFFHV